MVGSSSIESRLWLRYHATALVGSVDDAVAALGALVKDSAVNS
jgi:hypothetical protein